MKINRVPSVFASNSSNSNLNNPNKDRNYMRKEKNY
jgi:hypothetical protein